MEADVVAHYAAHGLQAQTELGQSRGEGMVRVTRTGGDLDSYDTQDVAQVLVETWAENSVDSWALAVRAWALLKLAAERAPQELNGAMLYDADLGVPKTFDDPLAPDLHRHQFLAVLTVQTTTLTIPEEGPIQ
ncbi:hypothetical protein [Kocuria rosea]|uniref:hypothetical protein n=1 Tax=Kocuria rosea TaxID=1275 RepID=UPI003D33B0AA